MALYSEKVMIHCSVLAEEAIKKAVQSYYDSKGMVYIYK